MTSSSKILFPQFPRIFIRNQNNQTDKDSLLKSIERSKTDDDIPFMVMECCIEIYFVKYAVHHAFMAYLFKKRREKYLLGLNCALGFIISTTQFDAIQIFIPSFSNNIKVILTSIFGLVVGVTNLFLTFLKTPSELHEKINRISNDIQFRILRELQVQTVFGNDINRTCGECMNKTKAHQNSIYQLSNYKCPDVLEDLSLRDLERIDKDINNWKKEWKELKKKKLHAPGLHKAA